jgi:hypothetical protein
MIDFSKTLESLTKEIAYQKHLIKNFDSTKNPQLFYQEELPITPYWNMLATVLNAVVEHGKAQEYTQFNFPYPDILNTAIVELFHNSVTRGNKDDLSKKVIINVLGGKYGTIITSTDEGEGYDHHKQLETFRKISEFELKFGARNTGYMNFDKEGLLYTVADEGRTGIIKLSF